ncbi:efflux RND transporter periplasmic adaptor subunit [Sphingomonas panacisoli]|uniref:Efflux RND transporter periplasmic adaptor subunit n=1 Tax=Sphingomonas panacisoli TaxID=1813879 RepID=A0A5B8LKR4_9SPHN|nr:efflux RND transporter periplasmic adaptor subunit [Sphingomonas panacisoli]QDZ08636.1 efflux RND transporter periplasmic adaptor subunit [Sphingomonas panacisoli]
MNMLAPINEAEAQPVEVAPPRSPLWRRAMWVVAPLVVLAGGYGLFQRPNPAMAAPPPPTVTVATPLQREVTEWDDYVGRFEPSRSVEVRPRVSGAVVAIHFTDGQIVKAGQPLFTIDPRPYAAALAEARAGIATASSELALANANYQRALKLVDVDAVSKSEVDRLKAQVQAASAALAAAQARVRSKALDMEFTVVRAPIGGRISDRKIDVGNLVAAGEGAGATLLTTINALDPIYFSFDGSEALFLKAKRAGAGNASPVEIRLQDEGDYRWKGSLDFTDNGLDPKSGTIRGRAVLSNPVLFLTPGMFGNMRLASGGKTAALMVPDTAIVTDQARKTVLVVGKDGTVSAKPVQLGPVVDGLRVIRGGLTLADRVVITGTQMAMPGTKVQILIGTIKPTAMAPAPAIAPPTPGQATLAQ